MMNEDNWFCLLVCLEAWCMLKPVLLCNQVRQMAAVLLRRLLSSSFEEIYPGLTVSLQAAIKTELVTIIQTENAPNIRKKVCDVAAELSRNLVGMIRNVWWKRTAYHCFGDYFNTVFLCCLDDDGNNQWPELLKFLFDSVNSPNVGLREAALHIFWWASSDLITFWMNFGCLVGGLSVLRLLLAFLGTSQESLATSSSTTWKWSNVCLFSACRTRPTHRWVLILWFLGAAGQIFFTCMLIYIWFSLFGRYVPWLLGQRRPLFLQMKETQPCWSNSLTCFLASYRYTLGLSHAHKCWFKFEGVRIVFIKFTHGLLLHTSSKFFEHLHFPCACCTATYVSVNDVWMFLHRQWMSHAIREMILCSSL